MNWVPCSLSVIVAFVFFHSWRSEARPEYATQTKVNCAACHVNVWGGGPRTVFGKSFGSHGAPVAQVSTSDLYYASLRYIGYYPFENFQTNPKGSTIMEAAITGNIPVGSPDSSTELRVVGTYNVATLGGPQLREAYVRWQLSKEEPYTAPFITLGRFYEPFGLLTDEHRTYTRIQTASEINNYYFGGAFSADPVAGLHTDFILVTTLQGDSGFVSNDVTWGSTLNIKWNASGIPFLLGASGNYQRTLRQNDPYASSIYTVLSLDRLTRDSLSGSLSFERVDAWNWSNSIVNVGQINPNVIQFFVPASAAGYAAGISQVHSVGYYGLFKYNLSKYFTLVYKLDYLDLNQPAGSGNSYVRNGIGLETYLNSNLIVTGRVEFASVPDQFKGTNVLAEQNNVFLMFRAWL